jgi:multidrug transporter EmrE-like cation transporter
MWFRLMMVAFLFNGLCTFGLRILTALGLTAEFTSNYLVFWYLGGFVFVLLVALRSAGRFSGRDVLVGGGLGLFSACGQMCLGLALSKGLPGNVVYPVTHAGGLFLVVAAGILVFKEHVGKAGLAGICLGILSIALLSLE